MRIIEKVAEGFTSKTSTGILCLEIEKAVDKVWHQGLLHEMYNGVYKTLKVIIYSQSTRDNENWRASGFSAWSSRIQHIHKTNYAELAIDRMEIWYRKWKIKIKVHIRKIQTTKQITKDQEDSRGKHLSSPLIRRAVDYQTEIGLRVCK